MHAHMHVDGTLGGTPLTAAARRGLLWGSAVLARLSRCRDCFHDPVAKPHAGAAPHAYAMCTHSPTCAVWGCVLVVDGGCVDVKVHVHDLLAISISDFDNSLDECDALNSHPLLQQGLRPPGVGSWLVVSGCHVALPTSA